METSSARAFAQAQQVIPGGVNSPARAFGAVGGGPRFVDRGNGALLYDVDGAEYIDYVCSWGPLIFGHAHPRVVKAVQEACARGTSFGAPTRIETELAEQIVAMVPSIEMVRMVNSGTEATMSAVEATMLPMPVEATMLLMPIPRPARVRPKRLILRPLPDYQECQGKFLRHAFVPGEFSYSCGRPKISTSSSVKRGSPQSVVRAFEHSWSLARRIPFSGLK